MTKKRKLYTEPEPEREIKIVRRAPGRTQKRNRKRNRNTKTDSNPKQKIPRCRSQKTSQNKRKKHHVYTTTTKRQRNPDSIPGHLLDKQDLCVIVTKYQELERENQRLKKEIEELTYLNDMLSRQMDQGRFSGGGAHEWVY